MGEYKIANAIGEEVDVKGEWNAIYNDSKHLSALAKISIESDKHGAVKYFQANPQKAKDLIYSNKEKVEEALLKYTEEELPDLAVKDLQRDPGKALVFLSCHYTEELQDFKKRYQVTGDLDLDSLLNDASRRGETLQLKDASNTEKRRDINPPQ